jgi:hypothetical protein
MISKQLKKSNQAPLDYGTTHVPYVAKTSRSNLSKLGPLPLNNIDNIFHKRIQKETLSNLHYSLDLSYSMEKRKYRFFIYPYVFATESHQHINQYIHDFVTSLQATDHKISNIKSRTHALLSVFYNFFKTDIFCFHWLENVPLYNHGLFQFFVAKAAIILIKIFNKQIVWFRHNTHPHNIQNIAQKYMCYSIMDSLTKHATLIITHSTAGIVGSQSTKNKTKFLMHPTKNNGVVNKIAPKWDILIWGNISKYKGTADFITYNKLHQELHTHKIKIIGRCTDRQLLRRIDQDLCTNINFENRTIGYQELKQTIAESRFILIPYAPASILSSAILMDSLSFGASIIGPNVGAFQDIKQHYNLNISLFESYSDIKTIVQSNHTINIEEYDSFLNSHTWDIFTNNFINHIYFSSLNKLSAPPIAQKDK